MSEETPISGDRPEVRNWTLETDAEDIAWLGLRMAGSTNVLSQRVLLELDTVLDALYVAPPKGLVLFSHKENGFIAGADIKEFPLLKTAEEAEQKVFAGHEVLARLEQLPFPTVAALNGTALGGGLELALACNWRIAFESERPTLGLPEVQLGVHPGLGGTVRATELVGVRSAMELMLTGKSIRPAKALKTGLIDCITTAETWRDDAVKYARRKGGKRTAPFMDRVLSSWILRPVLANVLRKQLRIKANPEHYPAPFAIIDLWRRTGCTRKHFANEARSFAQLAFTSTSKNLVRVFLLQDRMKSLAKASETEFAHVHVVGAGTMGADIAAWCAIRGMSVTLQDRERQYVDTGLERARKSMKRKLRNDDLVEEAAARLVGDHTGEGAHSADLVIEAIFENLEAKQKLFKDLEQRARPNTLLASNTSSIPLDQIASVLEHPERLVGLHFFNPVAQMPLVEVVYSEGTRKDEIDTATAFVKQIGKLPLPCKGLPGFLVNRILAPYMDEAFRLYEEGIQPEAIDKAATDFGMPVGPLELADTVGLDILLHVANIVGETIGRTLPKGISTLVDQKRLGEKSGRGFYSWHEGKAQKQPVKGKIDAEVQDRLILSLVNEAAACVADNVVTDSDLADAGTIFGAGFAPFRGGPIQYAREQGIDSIRESLQQLEQKHGARFKASSGWQKISAESHVNS